MSDVRAILQAKAGVGELVEACARKDITFDELCRRVHAMGYRTTSLHEMVCQAESGGLMQMSHKPRGCDPCNYPDCGCAYSQDDPRRGLDDSDRLENLDIAQHGRRCGLTAVNRGG